MRIGELPAGPRGVIKPVAADQQRFYAGIGSRETPEDVLQEMSAIARRLSALGYTLRSGGADGADTYFSTGSHRGCKPVIYVPWRGFHRPRSHEKVVVATELPEWPRAEALAAKHHPYWEKCSQGARKLLTRNGFQVLGDDLRSPSDFVVCWTKNGGPYGGTGQALRLAAARDVPIFNLFNTHDRDMLMLELDWADAQK